MANEWTVERHLHDKPEHVVALYRRFIELAEAHGPFRYAVAKTAISLKGSRRGFAGASPKKASLDGYFDLQRRVQDPRIRRSSPYTKRLFVHHFRVIAMHELDAPEQEVRLYVRGRDASDHTAPQRWVAGPDVMQFQPGGCPAGTFVKGVSAR